jgi:hypothetical protein
MGTIRVKSTELVRKFADIKSLLQETGSKVIVEEYNKPVLAIYPCDENGEAIIPDRPMDIEELEKLKTKFKRKKITIQSVSFS